VGGALVLDPAVLLLDEPLGALDAKLRRSVKVELKALQERVCDNHDYETIATVTGQPVKRVTDI
jgi:ABC-type sulfate/molybdate transport systems ATPase subunit